MTIMEQLTDRQKQVVSQIVTGATQKQVARELQLSPNTIRNHLASARKATGCVSTIELAVKFYVETTQTNG
jgi:DNA-binding CsgD family transcriptional regulator